MPVFHGPPSQWHAGHELRRDGAVVLVEPHAVEAEREVDAGTETVAGSRFVADLLCAKVT
jgi:hypothetical protein